MPLRDFERLHRERKRIRTVRLEAEEVVTPGVEPTGGEEHFAEISIGFDVPRVEPQHGLVRGDRRIIGAFLLVHDAEVEVGRLQIGRERERGERRICSATPRL